MTNESPVGVAESQICDVPVAVIDIETTGLHPGADRMVEVSVVRLEPTREPVIVLDTLLNPQRPVAATEIHGITEGDVADAPAFSEVAGDVATALSEAVVTAYNVYFDVRFLTDEFSRVGWSRGVPHLCLMHMRPMLGLGRKCCLSDACRAHGIEHREAHTAAYDALAGARLWNFYADVMAKRGLRTFGDLAGLRAYKFVDSLRLPPMPAGVAHAMSRGGRQKSRRGEGSLVPARSRADLVHEYWDAVTAAVVDWQLSDEEVRDLEAKRARFGLTVEELRAVHARVFAAMLGEALSDSLVTDTEWAELKRLHACLAQLGWAPGM